MSTTLVRLPVAPAKANAHPLARGLFLDSLAASTALASRMLLVAV